MPCMTHTPLWLPPAIGPYGLMLYLACVWLHIQAFRAAKKTGSDPWLAVVTTTIATAAGLFTARLGFLTVEVLQGRNHTWFDSGQIFYASIPGALLGAWFGAHLFDLRVMPLLNSLAPHLAMAHAIGRMGCYFGGCCFGNILGVPIQLVEALLLLGLAAGLKLKNAGFFPYVTGYAVLRFFTEYAREDITRGVFGPFSTSQWCAIAIVIGLGSLRFFANPARALEH